MSTFLVILIIVAAVAAYWGFDRLLGKGMNAVDRKLIRPNTYAKGQDSVRSELSLSAPTPPHDLVSKIVAGVGATSARPSVVAQVYLKNTTSDSVLFAFGSAVVGDIFLAEVDLTTTAEGSQGVFHVLAWQESGADVSGVSQLNQLRDTVRRSVVAAGGTARVVSSSTK